MLNGIIRRLNQQAIERYARKAVPAILALVIHSARSAAYYLACRFLCRIVGLAYRKAKTRIRFEGYRAAVFCFHEGLSIIIIADDVYV